MVSWVKPTNLDTTTKEFIVTKGDTGNYEWMLQEGPESALTINNVSFVIINTGNGQYLEAISTTVLSNDSWYHVVGVYEIGNVAKIYVNGVLENTDSTTTGIMRGNNVSKLMIGAREDLPDTFWEGSIDEVMVFNRALSPEQISVLYNNQTNLIVSNETLTDQDWQACATANDGVRNGKQVCSSVLTVMANMSITTSVTPYLIENLSSVTFDMSVISSEEAVNATWATVTYPNGTTITATTSFPYVFSSTLAIGRYNVTFYANDSNGDRVSNDDYFESAPFITFDFTIIDSATSGVDSSWELYYRDEIIASGESSVGNHSIDFPDVLADLLVKSPTERLQITFRDINATLENGKRFGIEKRTIAETGYLVTYGVNNLYSFTSATVKIYYDDLGFSNEVNLQLWKCDNFDFWVLSCSGTWTDITSSSTQNTGSDYFEYNTTSFSGFSIKQYVAPVAAATTSSGGGGGGGCAAGYSLEDGKCVKIEEELEEEIPSQLFDITFNLEDKIMKSVSKLVGIITFESFGTVPTLVDLTFIILDETENEIYKEESDITVTTEEVLRWNYEGLQELDKGKYVAILETLYNVDVADEFRQEFEIDGESVIAVYAKENWVWYLAGAGISVLLISLVWWLIKRFRNIRRKKSISFEGKVSKILQGTKVK